MFNFSMDTTDIPHVCEAVSKHPEFFSGRYGNPDETYTEPVCKSGSDLSVFTDSVQTYDTLVSLLK